MPVKWSPLRVSEAMDILEEQVNQIMEPLESAKLIVAEAEKIPNLPQYITQSLFSMKAEIDRVAGGIGWDKQFQLGSFHRIIERVREDLPKETLDTERKHVGAGSQSSLM